jgi:predicted lysophospholipase L1 biosynthesis ABC-type transport system permease subunit
VSRRDIEIVGVVKDSRYVDLREATPRFVYLPVGQREPESLTLYVRTAGDPLRRAAMLREVVRELDANLPVFDMKTLSAQVDDSLAQERAVAWLTGWFGGLATALAAIGIYGILAFTVARRTREIGVRLALGAERGDVVSLVLRQTALVVGTGLVLGLAGAGALGQLVASSPYGVRRPDGHGRRMRNFELRCAGGELHSRTSRGTNGSARCAPL